MSRVKLILGGYVTEKDLERERQEVARLRFERERNQNPFILFANWLGRTFWLGTFG